MDDQQRQCRICGSSKLDELYYDLEVGKLELYQLLKRDGSLDQLIRPCECRGEFAFAHKICLSNWLETTKHEYCDICRFKYNASIIEKSIFDWLFQTSQVERATKLACIGLLVYYLSAIGIMITNNDQPSVLKIMIRSSSYIWTFKCTIGLLVVLHRELISFKTWKQHNRRIIVDENKNPQLECQTTPKDVLRSSGFKPNLMGIDRTIMKV